MCVHACALERDRVCVCVWKRKIVRVSTAARRRWSLFLFVSRLSDRNHKMMMTVLVSLPLLFPFIDAMMNVVPETFVFFGFKLARWWILLLQWYLTYIRWMLSPIIQSKKSAKTLRWWVKDDIITLMFKSKPCSIFGALAPNSITAAEWDQHLNCCFKV